MRLAAKITSFEDDGYSTTLAFGSDGADPERYVILQIVNDPEPQDFRLGHDGVHLEIEGGRLTGYNLLSAMEASAESIRLELSAVAASRVGGARWIDISLPDRTISGLTIEEALRSFKVRMPGAQR
ncbi:hypothetical protein [Roseateles chitinivorans]|uniref:hypothetical protein n=1 Tax=Roseateles chitinivorans TaxID=2917965 RepID=UPI003D677156